MDLDHMVVRDVRCEEANRRSGLEYDVASASKPTVDLAGDCGCNMNQAHDCELSSNLGAD